MYKSEVQCFCELWTVVPTSFNAQWAIAVKTRETWRYSDIACQYTLQQPYCSVLTLLGGIQTLLARSNTIFLEVLGGIQTLLLGPTLLTQVDAHYVGHMAH